jgi:hypothetical protein
VKPQHLSHRVEPQRSVLAAEYGPDLDIGWPTREAVGIGIGLEDID